MNKTIFIAAMLAYKRERKLSELAAVIKGVSYPGISYMSANAGEKKAETKAASSIEKSQKLKELELLIKGLKKKT
jgi:hypothetical protein